MELKVIRKYKKDTYTIGKLYIDGEYFCDTLEDKDRGLKDSMTLQEIKDKKVYGNTAIPSGKYQVKITFSQKYQRYMPLIENVKGYDGIRIHSGNTDKDTLGCILVGENKEKGKVINSRTTFNKLYNILCEAEDKGITISIE